MSVPDDIVALVEAGEEHAVEVDGPDPIVDFLQADVVLFEGVAMNSSRCLKRKVPAFVTRFTRKCPGYSSGGSCSG